MVLRAAYAMSGTCPGYALRSTWLVLMSGTDAGMLVSSHAVPRRCLVLISGMLLGPSGLPDLWTTLQWRVAVISNWVSAAAKIKCKTHLYWYKVYRCCVLFFLWIFCCVGPHFFCCCVGPQKLPWRFRLGYRS